MGRQADVTSKPTCTTALCNALVVHQLSLPAQLQAVPPQPVGPSGATLGLVELVSFAETSARLAGSCEASELPVLLHCRAHPVDLRVSSHSRVMNVNHYHLIILVRRVLSHPIGVEDTKSFEPSANSLLGDELQVPLRLLLVHRSRGLGLAIGAPLRHRPFPASPPHGDPVDAEALLGL